MAFDGHLGQVDFVHWVPLFSDKFEPWSAPPLGVDQPERLADLVSKTMG